MKEIDKERFLNIYNYFENTFEKGIQRRKLNEEYQELQDELLKFDLAVGTIEDMITEFADVFNLLFQHMYANDIEPKEVYDELIRKLERTEYYIKTKKYEKDLNR